MKQPLLVNAAASKTPPVLPGMEPGDLRESPAGSGESDAGDWREVIPGGEEDDKGAENIGNTLDATHRDTCDEVESDKQKCVGEPLHSPYEEELDPRIQVGESSSEKGSWCWSWVSLSRTR